MSINYDTSGDFRRSSAVCVCSGNRLTVVPVPSPIERSHSNSQPSRLSIPALPLPRLAVSINPMKTLFGTLFPSILSCLSLWPFTVCAANCFSASRRSDVFWIQISNTCHNDHHCLSNWWKTISSRRVKKKPERNFECYDVVRIPSWSIRTTSWTAQSSLESSIDHRRAKRCWRQRNWTIGDEVAKYWHKM
jgi:hypothetical protein